MSCRSALGLHMLCKYLNCAVSGPDYARCCCREVRRQTCDLVTLMDVAQPMSHYFMFMEDDFRCAPGWQAPLYVHLLVCPPRWVKM